MNYVTPMELYEAARETCIRLYVLNGGAPQDKWHIRPFPGTAAISCTSANIYSSVSRIWTLCMPAFPMNAKLPRWKSDLIGAYTVHELLHALWTDWAVVKQTRLEKLHSLCNALEDCRIEARASKGHLVQVSEARRLLEALNAHIAKRALTTQGFSLNAPEQFSFVLGLVIFAEKLGYASELPADWRARVRPEWHVLFDHALTKFDGLASTQDVLVLARELKTLALTMPKPQRPQPQPQVNLPPFPMPKPSMPDMPAPMPHEPEIVEPSAPEIDDNPNKPQPPSESSQKPADGQEGDKAKNDAAEAQEPSTGSPEGEGDDAEGNDAEGDDTEGDDTEGDDADADDADDDADADADADAAKGAGVEDDDDDDAEPSDQTVSPDGASSPEERGGRDDTGEREFDAEPEPEPADDLSDTTQVYSEANLNDLSQDTIRESGVNPSRVFHEAQDADMILNAKPLLVTEPDWKGANPTRFTSLISAPAKLRRHLTSAVKSPERVSKDRHQVSGRLDMRNLVGIMTGSSTVFTRRIEDEGREAVVTLLIDISGSMKGFPLDCAKALALHMGDTLKAAGVRFEVSAFDDRFLVTPKPLGKAWNTDTKRAVAGLKVIGGTCMLTAIRACGERLIKTPNATRRILMVLSDGADSYSATANGLQCQTLRRKGVEVIGLALQSPGMETTFNGAVVDVRNAAQLSEQGLGALVKALDQGAPRLG
jgi:uncharacterized protein with von Willebrand factor type A (vWA) domain